MSLKKNITAYSVLDFSQCHYKTWLDYLEKPKSYPKNIDPWLEIIRKIGIEHEKSYLEDLRKSNSVYEISEDLDFSEKWNWCFTSPCLICCLGRFKLLRKEKVTLMVLGHF